MTKVSVPLLYHIIRTLCCTSPWWHGVTVLLNTCESQDTQDHSEKPSRSEQSARASLPRTRQEGNERPDSIGSIHDDIPPKKDLVEQIASRRVARGIARVVGVSKPRHETEADLSRAAHASENGAAGSCLGAELHETAE